MIICPHCARDNEDHYKFCLGCGTELSKLAGAPPPPARPSVVVARAVPMPTGGVRSPQPVATALPVAAPLPVATALPVATPLPVATALPVAPARVVVGFDDAQPFDPTVDSVPGAEPPAFDVPPLSPPAFEVSVMEAPAFDTPEAGVAALAEPAGISIASPLVVPTTPGLPPASREPPPPAEAPMGRKPSEPPGVPLDPPTVPPAGRAFEDPFAEVVPRVIQVSPEAADEPPTDGPQREEPPTDQAQGVDLEDIPLPTRPPLGRAEATVVGEEPGFDLHPSLVSVVREAASRRCPACKSAVPEGFKFCGVCGSRYEPAAISTSPVLRARLVLIHPDGREGDAFDLPAGECVVGRDVGPTVFAEDPFLSPRHATFSSGPGRLSVRDEGSLNGVFLRLRDEIELMHRDLFRVGQQLLRFEDMRHVRPVVQPANDGTLVFGSPARGTWGRLAALVSVETVAHVWTLVGPQVSIGRERGDIKFPQDGFVSGAHCIVSTRQGRFFLSDQGSTNGTYLRVKGEQTLNEGDLLLLGQQLFRVVIG
jgi:pSer/pThr/pTyr-binding forkhead associated (FHA) protein